MIATNCFQNQQVSDSALSFRRLPCLLRIRIHLVGFVVSLILPQVLNCSEENNLRKRHKLTEDQPDVNHLDVRGGGQALHLADEDGRHHQHSGQVQHVFVLIRA